MSSSTGSAVAAPLLPEDLWQLYKIAVDEYRFQVSLNWQRSQYYLGLNAGIIAVGAGLTHFGAPASHENGAPLTVAVFLVGLVLALSSMFAVWKQHAYYRTARNRMVDVGNLLDLGSLAVATTPGSAGVPPLRLKVQTVTYGVFAILGAVNVFGAIYILSR